MNDRVVIIPTYNEKENIENILRYVFKLEPKFDVLVIEDNSPDGTAQIVKRLQEKENVEFILNTTVQEIRGEQMVESLRVLNKVTGEESELAVSGIFVAVGQIAQNEKFADVVQLDEGGFIVAGEDCKTSEAGIYAAGDCRTKEVRQLTTAAADGAVAALAACKYIADVAEK